MVGGRTPDNTELIPIRQPDWGDKITGSESIALAWAVMNRPLTPAELNQGQFQGRALRTLESRQYYIISEGSEKNMIAAIMEYEKQIDAEYDPNNEEHRMTVLALYDSKQGVKTGEPNDQPLEGDSLLEDG